MNGLALIGFADSVYTRVIRMALHEKDVSHEYEEVNPFSEDGQAALKGLHPFGRVPVLRHYAFVLYETAAILGYLDDALEGPSLTPGGAKARARVTQVQGMVDSYVYWPLVRQVFSQGVYLPHLGLEADETILAEGLAAASPILDALEEVAEAGLILTGRDITRADCHLAPMIDYFALYPAGAGLLKDRPALSHWFKAVSARPSFIATRPAFVRDLETTT